MKQATARPRAAARPRGATTKPAGARNPQKPQGGKEPWRPWSSGVWEERWSRSKNRPYYYNRETKESQWDAPEGSSSGGSGTSESAAGVEEEREKARCEREAEEVRQGKRKSGFRRLRKMAAAPFKAAARAVNCAHDPELVKARRQAKADAKAHKREEERKAAEALKREQERKDAEARTRESEAEAKRKAAKRKKEEERQAEARKAERAAAARKEEKRKEAAQKEARAVDEEEPKTKAAALRTLQLPAGATPAEIRKAWRDLTRKFHPDKNREDSAEVAAVRFRHVNDAYKILTGQK